MVPSYRGSRVRPSCCIRDLTQLRLRTRPICLVSRAGAFFHQMDWLGVYFGHIPAVVKPLQTFLMHGKTLALERMQRGSTRCDLFHYLVGQPISHAH